jgi:rhamnulose-1-phosphate aldolase
MKNILEAKFVQELCKITSNMYRQGWDERNGGNVSVLLDENEVKEYLDVNKVIREIPTGFDAKELVGKYFIVTGTGKYFKNVIEDPETNLGIIRIGKDGLKAELLWGYKDGGKFTSELPAHLMTHATRLKIDPNHRVVMHTHPTYTICMSAVLKPDDKLFTEKLWRSNTEAIVVFPDGVGVLPCMVCGTNEIGIATAKKMETYRLVVWTNHGIYGVGKDIDEAFGLIETVEKTAQLYMLTLGKVVNEISDDVLKGLVDLWHLKPLDGILKK